MTRNIAIPLFALPLLLAACGTPQERCIRQHTVEYRNVSRLLTQVEGNLARGYAWQERTATREVLRYCREYSRNSDGTVDIDVEPCWDDVTYTQRYRVPIDPATEARKRDNLTAKKAALSGQAEAYVMACEKAFPEEEKAAP